MIKTLRHVTFSRHYDIVAKPRSIVTTAITCARQNDAGSRTHPTRLRVVPHFSSGIVERHAACRLFSRGVIFTRVRVSLALLSLRKNGGLLVV